MEIIKKLFMLEAKMALGIGMFMLLGIAIIAISDRELYHEMKKSFIIAWYTEAMPAMIRWCYKNTR